MLFAKKFIILLSLILILIIMFIYIKKIKNKNNNNIITRDIANTSNTFIVQLMPSVNGILFKNPKSINYNDIYILPIETNVYSISYNNKCSLFLLLTNKDNTITPINIHIDDNQNIRVAGTSYYRIVKTDNYPILQISYSHMSTLNTIKDCLFLNRNSLIDVGPYFIISVADTSRIFINTNGDTKATIIGMNTKYPTWVVKVERDDNPHAVTAIIVNNLGQIYYLTILFNLGYNKYGEINQNMKPVVMTAYNYGKSGKIPYNFTLTPCSKDPITNKVNNDGDYYAWFDGNHNIILQAPKTEDFYNSGTIIPFPGSLSYPNWNYILHNYWFIIQGTKNTKTFVFLPVDSDPNVRIDSMSDAGYDNCYAVNNTIFLPPPGTRAEVEVVIIGKNNIVTSFVISWTNGYMDFTNKYIQPDIKFVYSGNYIKDVNYKIIDNIIILDQPTYHTDIKSLFTVDEVYKSKIDKYYKDSIKVGIFVASMVFIPLLESQIIANIIIPISSYITELLDVSLLEIDFYGNATEDITITTADSTEADSLLNIVNNAIKSKKFSKKAFVNELLKILTILNSKGRINNSGVVIKLLANLRFKLEDIIKHPRDDDEEQIRTLYDTTITYIPQEILNNFLGDIWNYEL